MKYFIYTIDGASVPSPVSFQLELNDIDAGETTRTGKGTLNRKIIMPGVRNFTIEWERLTEEGKNELLKATSARKGHAFFTVKFEPDGSVEPETSEFYRGKVTITQEPGYGAFYKLSMSFVERGRIS